MLTAPRHGKNVVEGAVVSLADFQEQLFELTNRKDWGECPYPGPGPI